MTVQKRFSVCTHHHARNNAGTTHKVSKHFWQVLEQQINYFPDRRMLRPEFHNQLDDRIFLGSNCKKRGR